MTNISFLVVYDGRHVQIPNVGMIRKVISQGSIMSREEPEWEGMRGELMKYSL